MGNSNNEKGYTEKIAVSKSTKEKVDECKEEYREHNKDARHRKITYNEIIRKIAEFYMEQE